MSTTREKILTAIRSALASPPRRAFMPEWEDDLAVYHPFEEEYTLKTQFADRLKEAGGHFFERSDLLTSFLLKKRSVFGFCDPDLAHLLEGVNSIFFDTEFDPGRIKDYTFGLTRAIGGIAESGTIVLKDHSTSARVKVPAPWTHIAVIHESDIVGTIGDARACFGDDPSLLFSTRPSKTAVVDGILAEGVHGPRIQAALVQSDSGTSHPVQTGRNDHWLVREHLQPFR